MMLSSWPLKQDLERRPKYLNTSSKRGIRLEIDTLQSLFQEELLLFRFVEGFVMNLESTIMKLPTMWDSTPVLLRIRGLCSWLTGCWSKNFTPILCFKNIPWSCWMTSMKSPSIASCFLVSLKKYSTRGKTNSNFSSPLPLSKQESLNLSSNWSQTTEARRRWKWRQSMCLADCTKSK